MTELSPKQQRLDTIARYHSTAASLLREATQEPMKDHVRKGIAFLGDAEGWLAKSDTGTGPAMIVGADIARTTRLRHLGLRGTSTSRG